MKWHELVLEYFPSATDEQAHDVLWCCTGWPHFWSGDSAEAHFRKQLEEYQRRSFGDPELACILADEDTSMDMKWFKIREEVEK